METRANYVLVGLFTLVVVAAGFGFVYWFSRTGDLGPRDGYVGDPAVNNLRVATKTTPRPGPGEVLVRIAAAPCNPSDITFMQGLYGVRKALPAVPGWEGAGTVVASGGGIHANRLKGRRVACGGQADSDGTWAEYYLAPAKSCVPLRKSLSFEQGAGLIVNPLTAWALFGKAKQGRHPGIVQTAAGVSGFSRIDTVWPAKS